TTTPTPAPPATFTQNFTSGGGSITILSTTPAAGSTISLGSVTTLRPYAGLALQVTSSSDLNQVWFFAGLRNGTTRCIKNSDYSARSFTFRANTPQTVVINLDQQIGCGSTFSTDSLEVGPVAPSTSNYIFSLGFSGGYKFTP